MARIRTIKPEFFRHSGLYRLEVETGLPVRLAFAGLWTAADREGRFKWDPDALKLDALPYDPVDFSRVLDALATRGFIRKYVSGSREYGCIPSWKDHQSINNREAESVLPSPQEFQEESDTSTRDARVHDASPTPLMHAPVEGKGREGKGREEKKSAPVGGDSPAGSPPADPIWGTGLAFLTRKGLEVPSARRLLGKLRREVGDIRAGGILAQAEIEDVADPVPWIMAAAQRSAAAKDPPAKTRRLL